VKIDFKDVNFEQVGKRVKAYRLMQGLSEEDMANLVLLKPGTIVNIENGQQYCSLNQLWTIVNAIKVSIPWFFFGEGKFDDCSDEDLPLTIMCKRGPGIPRGDERLSAELGQYEGDTFEFILAVEGFKNFNNKSFPSLTEIFELFISLGYRKIDRPTINPCKAIEIHDEC